MSPNTWYRLGLQAKELHHLHAQLSLGRSCHRQKKSCAYAHRVALVVSNSLQPCRLAYLEKEMATHSSILAWSNSSSRLAYQVSLSGVRGRGGGSPGKNTRAYWPILAARPFWSAVFPAALAANCPE